MVGAAVGEAVGALVGAAVGALVAVVGDAVGAFVGESAQGGVTIKLLTNQALGNVWTQLCCRYTCLYGLVHMAKPLHERHLLSLATSVTKMHVVGLKTQQ